VNERLYAQDLLADWDAAAQREDRTAIIDLLQQIELEDQAEAIADQVLQARKRPSFP